MADKYPWFKFYRRDWSHHPNLRRCSRAARSLWIDLICLVYECEEPGVFATAGKPWTDEEVAGAVDGGADANLPLLRELLDKEVAKRRRSGAIYSNRVVHDVEVREAHAKAGSSGGQAKAKQKSSKHISKCSDSVSESESLFSEIPETLRTESVRGALREWCAHCRDVKKRFTKRAAGMSFKKWAEEGWTPQRVVAAIHYSIRQVYKGIYEDPMGQHGRSLRPLTFTEKRQSAVDAAIAAEIARIPRKESA
jgi:hypothetical protein